MTTEEKPSKVYDGSCQCETVKYTVKISPPIPDWEVVSCNCTICSRNGYLFVYPYFENLHFVSGQDNLRMYTYHRKWIGHYFCTTCGSSIYAKSHSEKFHPEVAAVNVRMLDGVDLKSLKIQEVDKRDEW
ncbi:Mss4-like protein [Lineolata rhizophorae]|uniref:Mss4-like protein n=1 Tax=Lineolata rhizophorae TaxID=578093 RepID=A0A6A6NLZ3_9PEZI|nr:Mss4-like protein [Lineolata rhizophorae]